MELQYTPKDKIDELIRRQRLFFASDTTRDCKWRRERLRDLREGIRKWERELLEAIWNDLHKSHEEAYITEIGLIYNEINYHMRHLKHWMRPRRVRTPLFGRPSRSKIVYEPRGCALIVAPWNYPINLSLLPLVGAISAGCTAIVKCSEMTPSVSIVLEKMIREIFPQEYIAVVQGAKEENEYLFAQRFDFVLLTGSAALGRALMAAQAPFLTPLLLELGGKSPCIITKKANLKLAARRIAWGKCLNCGQTCIAPDYLLLHQDIKDDFIRAFQQEINTLYPEGMEESKYYARIVNERAFQRINSYLSEGNVVAGGRCNHETRWIEPTLLDNVPTDAPVMTEEIFGPILPIQTFDQLEEAIAFINDREKPLTIYVFGNKREGEKIIQKTSSGSVCMNDVIMHCANHHLPFGGVGDSGSGGYHGKYSFLAFSHTKAIAATPTWIDLPFRYMPYKYFRLLKRIL